MTQPPIEKHANAGAAVDWPRLYQRLDILQQALASDWMPTPERAQQILRQRAQALAQPLAVDVDAAQIDVIEFALGTQRYGIDTARVREVCPLTELWPVPCTPPYVLGLIDVRGEFISVVDLKQFFEIAEQGLSDLNKVIVLHSESMTFGILVDAIVAVRALVAADLQPPITLAMRADYLLGVTTDHLLVIDAKKLVSASALIVNDDG